MKRTLAIALLLFAGACGDSADGPAVARAGDHVLSVQELAEFIADRPQIPNDPQVVSVLADLWLDVTVLAQAAMQDSTFESVDLSSALARYTEDDLVQQLLEASVVADTIFTEEELRGLFATNAPGVEVAASHILFAFPTPGTPAQLDSVQELASSVAERARAGEDFAALAAEYSHDPGNAQTGGALGRFGRGSGLVEPFENAALELGSGEVSDPVETVFGLHVIKVTERFDPEFDEMQEAFQQQMVGQRMVTAESTYVAGLEGTTGLPLADDAITIARELSTRPEDRISGRAGERVLVTYEGGTYTAADFADWLRERTPQIRDQVGTVPDEAMRQLLENLARFDLLIDEARRQGLEVSQAESDSVLAIRRSDLAAYAAQLGLVGLEPLPGETRSSAVQAAVSDALARIVAGEAPFMDLGPIGFALRDQFDGSVNEENFAAVVAEVTRIGPPPGSPMPGGTPPPTAPPAGAGGTGGGEPPVGGTGGDGGSDPAGGGAGGR